MNYQKQFNMTNTDAESMKSSSIAAMGRNRGKARPTASRWAVTAPRAKPSYGLENGTVQINEPAAIVAARIDNCLRLRSVQAKFDSDRAEALCKTSSMVQYQIILYDAGDSDESGEQSTSTSTFVEIVKRNGDGFSFINERRAIVDAAKGLGGVKSRSPMMMVLPDEMLDQYVPPSDTEIEDMLDRATDQLHSKHYNAVIFALQNLYSMMTTDKRHSNVANQVSKYIIGNYNDIRDIIASLFASRAGDMKDERNEKICNLALDIFNSAMQAFLSDKNNDGGKDYECKYFVESMVPPLVAAVENYDQNPHTACLAMKCLSFMATSSSFARTMIGETNFAKDVEEAKVYGSMEHLRLEQEASSTMKTLQSQLVLAA